MFRDFEGLAERVETASGPSRELDAEIAHAIGAEHGEKSGWCNNHNGDYFVIDECAARYTESLDAALAVIPEGGWWSLDAHSNAVVVYDVRYGEGDDITWERDNTTACSEMPALALCAAALRARANYKAAS